MSKNYKIRMIRGCVLVAFALSALAIGAIRVQAADVEGSKDHPIISRYAGSEIISYQHKAFDEYGLVLGPTKYQDGKVKSESLAEYEGEVTRILYRAPNGRSTLEIIRNYEKQLEKAGFTVLFACKAADCGAYFYSRSGTAWKGNGWIDNIFITDPKEHRYLAAKLTRPEGDIYVSLYVIEHNFLNSIAGPYVHLDVLGLAAMEEEMVTVDAAALSKSIETEGHAAIYGIYFDTGDAMIKPESRPAIAEMSKLMQNAANMRLHVVGHTDSEGNMAYNLDLSRRRAAAVMDALVTAGIAADRLTANGVGFLAPVASNRTEEGRAKNRRVELVESLSTSQ